MPQSLSFAGEDDKRDTRYRSPLDRDYDYGVDLGYFFLLPEQLQLRSEEPRRALVAMEMIFSGDFLKPQIHGWPYYNKPPLFNWMIVLFMQIFKSFDEWVIRLPGLLSFAATGCFIYLFSKQHMPERASILAALFFLTGGEILFYGLIIAGQIDLFYTLVVILHISTLYLGLSEKKQTSKYLLLSYLFLALGTLTKGIPSLAFHGLTLLAWSLVNKRIETLWRWPHLVGCFLWLLIAGGYFYSYNQSGEGWTYVVNLYKEAAQKSALEGEVTKVLGNALAFPLLFLKTLLPWSVFILFILMKNIRRAIWNHPLAKFSSLFILANILLYGFAAHLTLRYLYPFLPFFAILLGYVVNLKLDDYRINYFHYLIVGLILFTPVGFVAIKFLPPGEFITNFWWRLMAVTLVSAALFLSWKKYQTQRIYLAILFVAILKIYSNWIYYPARAADEQENSLMAQVKKYLPYANGKSIMLYGNPVVMIKDADFGPLRLGEVTFAQPTQVSFQHPYYLEKIQHEIMIFHTEMKQGYVYLARAEDVKDLNVRVLYNFVDDWQRRPLVLCELE